MATAAPNQNLPIFYRAIEPLNVTQHGKMKVRPVLDMSEVAKTHAIPLTVDEFALVQRHYPIVFSIGEKPIPIALMGLNENVNVFLQDDGRPIDPSLYIPAYIRRYPFLLARIRPDSDELSLCVDPTANAIGNFKDGDKLFDGDQPSKATLRDPRILRTVRSCGPAHLGIHRGTDQERPADGRRSRDPAGRLRAAVHLSRFPDGR